MQKQKNQTKLNNFVGIFHIMRHIICLFNLDYQRIHHVFTE